MLNMFWEYEDARAVTDVGIYRLRMSMTGVSHLSLDWEKIYECPSGTHEANIKRAQDHYDALTRTKEK